MSSLTVPGDLFEGQRGIGHLLDLLGGLFSPTDLPSSICRPNLVAMTTWSRTGPRASPTSSSLRQGPVYLGGVEESDLESHSAAGDHEHGLPVAGVGPVALGHAHGAEADGRDLQALPEGARMHVLVPFAWR
jgi:hypothetical protein